MKERKTHLKNDVKVRTIKNLPRNYNNKSTPSVRMKITMSFSHPLHKHVCLFFTNTTAVATFSHFSIPATTSSDHSQFFYPLTTFPQFWANLNSSYGRIRPAWSPSRITIEEFEVIVAWRVISWVFSMIFQENPWLWSWTSHGFVCTKKRKRRLTVEFDGYVATRYSERKCDWFFLKFFNVIKDNVLDDYCCFITYGSQWPVCVPSCQDSRPVNFFFGNFLKNSILHSLLKISCFEINCLKKKKIKFSFYLFLN